MNKNPRFINRSETLKVKSPITGKEFRTIFKYVYCTYCCCDVDKSSFNEHVDTQKHLKNVKNDELKRKLLDILDYVENNEDDELIAGLIDDELKEFVNDNLIA